MLRAELPALIEEFRADAVIVNGENASGGRGITAKVATELLQNPVDIFTSGNHIWQHKDVAPFLESGKILRPHNAPPGRHGRGVTVIPTRAGVELAVINLQGRVFMYEGEQHACPLRTATALIAQVRERTPCIIIDFHAEITSEKAALARFVDGTASCVYGTHTHVQTADEQILPGGTAFITDIGMTGPHESILGARIDDTIKRFLSDGEKTHWEAAIGNPRLHGICVTIDDSTGRATHITRIARGGK